MDDDTKENLSARGTWMRLVYMVLFAIAFYVAEFILVFVVVIQFLFKLVSGAALHSPLKKASLTGFHATAKHIAAKAVSPSSETMRTI